MRISVLAAALMLGTSIASASPLNKYTTGLGYLPALPGGVPDRDFPIGRLSTNPLSIAYTPQNLLPGFSATSISAGQFSISPVGTLTLQVNTTAYPGTFLKGSLVKIRSASSFAATPSAAATISGVVADDSYDPSIGLLNLVAVAKFTFTGNVSYNDWTLTGHTPVLGNKSNAAASGTNAGTLVFYGRTTEQTIADWDWTNISANLQFYPGDLAGENATITVAQSLFQVTNLGPVFGTQPYKVTFCTMPFRPLTKNSYTATVVGAVQPNASNDLTACQITLDGVPSDLATSPSAYSVYNVTNPSSLLFVTCTAVSGNTITLANQLPSDGNAYKYNNVSYAPRTTPIQSVINDGDKIILYKYVGSGQIATGMCTGFSYNYVEVPLDCFFLLKTGLTEQSKIFGNIFVMTGHYPGTYHADWFQDYGFGPGPGFLVSNNIVLCRPKLGLRVNGNPRDLFQSPANYSIAAPREIKNNILEWQGLSTYVFFFEQCFTYNVTAIAPDPATGEIRVFYDPQQNPASMQSGDPYFVGGFDDGLGLNSTRALCGTAYSSQNITTISQSLNRSTSAQGAIGDVSLSMASTAGIIKGMLITLGGTVSTITDVDDAKIYFTPQLAAVVNAGATLSFPASITIAGSDASKLSGYTPIGFVTATVSSDAASGSDFIPIADTSNLRIGMVVTEYINASKVSSMPYSRTFIKAFVSGGIQVSRKLKAVIPAQVVLSFKAQIRPSKTALTSLHDNYIGAATSRFNISPVTTAGTVPQGGFWPYTIDDLGTPYGLNESSITPLQNCFSWYNNKRLLTDGNGVFTGVDPVGEIPFTIIASDTYQALGYSDENQYRGITQWNPPCAAPTGIRAKVVSGAATKATITYVADTASLGETFSLDGGLSWSDSSATGGLISSGATIVRGAASTIMLRSMNAYDDFAVPRNPGTASAAMAIAA